MILARRTLALLLVLPGCGLFDPTTDGNGGPRPSDPTTDLARIALQAHDQVRASDSSCSPISRLATRSEGEPRLTLRS